MSAEMKELNYYKRRTIEYGDTAVIIYPNQRGDVLHRYNRGVKLKTSTLLRKNLEGLSDTVNIPDEGKKRQILSRTTTEVSEKIRNAT